MKNKVRVLIVTAYFYPDISGVGKHTYNLCTRLISNYNYQISVVTSGSEYREEIINGIKVYRLPYWFKLSNTPINLWWVVQVKNIIDKENPQIINPRAPVPFLPDIGGWLVGKRKLIVGYHFPSMVKDQPSVDWLINIYESTALRWLLNRADKLICSSNFVRNDFLGAYKSKSVTITQGIDMERFTPKKVEINNKLLFVGNYDVDYKGLSFLLKALCMLKDPNGFTGLQVVGSGDENFYKNMCKDLGISHLVEFTGKKYGDDLVEAYQKCKLVVVPSVVDNFPSVILEAMACGKPVIGTQVAGIPEMIVDGKDGFLVPPKDPQAIANVIDKLSRNPKLIELIGMKAYQKVKGNYNWDIQTKKTNDVFKSVL